MVSALSSDCSDGQVTSQGCRSSIWVWQCHQGTVLFWEKASLGPIAASSAHLVSS